MLKYLFISILLIKFINCKAVDKPPSYYILDLYFNGCDEIIRATLDVNTFESDCINIKNYCNFTSSLGLKVSYEYGNLYNYKRYVDSKCVINDHYNIFNCTKEILTKQNSTNGYSVQCYENFAPALLNNDNNNNNNEIENKNKNKPTVVKPKYASDSSINLDEIANKDRSNSKTKSPIPIVNNQEPDYTANSNKLKLSFSSFLIILMISIFIL